jgi:hypothetical protein
MSVVRRLAPRVKRERRRQEFVACEFVAGETRSRRSPKPCRNGRTPCERAGVGTGFGFGLGLGLGLGFGFGLGLGFGFGFGLGLGLGFRLGL